MSAKTFPVDGGGVTRRIKKWFAVDSGSVTRKLKKVWNIDPGGIARLVFQSADVLAMLAGGPTAGSTGYTAGGFGTLTPNMLGDGATVLELAASITPPYNMIFFIDTYPGTITSGYLTSLTIDSTVFLPASATFSGGGAGSSASWTWSSGFPFASGTNYTITVERT